MQQGIRNVTLDYKMRFGEPETKGTSPFLSQNYRSTLGYNDL